MGQLYHKSANGADRRLRAIDIDAIAVGRAAAARAYRIPWPTIASATFTKPAMFAPMT